MYVALETPPFLANTILNFHFDYLHTSLNVILDSTELRPRVEQPQDSGATTDSWFAQTGKRAS